MKPAAEKLSALFSSIEFKTPVFDVINNVDVKVETDVAAIKDALIRQLYSPVRWTETVQQIASQGINQSYEFGPGKVISGLVKRIDKALACESVNTPDTIAAAK